MCACVRVVVTVAWLTFLIMIVFMPQQCVDTVRWLNWLNCWLLVDWIAGVFVGLS